MTVWRQRTLDTACQGQNYSVMMEIGDLRNDFSRGNVIFNGNKKISIDSTDLFSGVDPEIFSAGSKALNYSCPKGNLCLLTA